MHYKSERLFQNIIEYIAEGIFVLNEAGEITFMNPEAERLLGWTARELADKNAHDIIHCHNVDGSSLPLEQCPMRNVIMTGNQYCSANDLFTHKSGSTFPISVLCSPIMEGDRIVASVTAFRDITALKRAEAALREAHEKLEDKVRARTEDLITLNEELEIKSQHLVELNATLKVLLRQRDDDKNELEDRICLNVKMLIIPTIEKLRKFVSNSSYTSYLDLLESNLLQIVSPFSMSLSTALHNLTFSEIEVANLIRAGKISRDIAVLLNISKDTVDSHRQNIRKKLGLNAKKQNLQSYLLALK
jgi:PAS domain S-box-containing protein